MKQKECKLRRFEIVLAFEPGVSFMEKISAFVEESFGKGISVVFRVDKGILGGALIYFDGRYLNGSLKKIVSEMMGKILSGRTERGESNG
jgi:F0F1-type ATP synthase delta subunit